MIMYIIMVLQMKIVSDQRSKDQERSRDQDKRSKCWDQGKIVPDFGEVKKDDGIFLAKT